MESACLVQSAAAVMASGGAEEREKPFASSKSSVWEHFSFPVKYSDDGSRAGLNSSFWAPDIRPDK